jgi:hypothetical protein
MNLRVFANASGNLLVEISHPSLKSVLTWFLPVLPQESPALRGIDPSRLVPVRLHEKVCQIPYLHIRTIRSGAASLTEAGQLEPEDSINVLNHIQDILAWD